MSDRQLQHRPRPPKGQGKNGPRGRQQGASLCQGDARKSESPEPPLRCESERRRATGEAGGLYNAIRGKEGCSTVSAWHIAGQQLCAARESLISNRPGGRSVGTNRQPFSPWQGAFPTLPCRGPLMTMTQTEKDCLTLALRLLGEDPETFSPEAAKVMDRWRPVCRDYIQTGVVHDAEEAQN